MDTKNNSLNSVAKKTSDLVENVSKKTSSVSSSISNTGSKIKETVKNIADKPIKYLMDKEDSPLNPIISFLKTMLFWLFIIIIIIIIIFVIMFFVFKKTNFLQNYINTFKNIILSVTDTLNIMSKTTTTNKSDNEETEKTPTQDDVENQIIPMEDNNENIEDKNNIDNNVNKDLKKSLEEDIITKKNTKQPNSNNDKITFNKVSNNEPEPVRSSSNQNSFCYIGKINDTRYCSKISSKAKCMSGDIFPTIESCMNPNIKS